MAQSHKSHKGCRPTSKYLGRADVGRERVSGGQQQIATAHHDMHWAAQKAELCQQQGQETERWRSEADVGFVMTHLGQENEGLAKLDEAISHLDAPGSIDRMDAFVVACKRKINALNELRRYKEIITLGQRILDRLDHYESHAKDYAEDSYRLS